MPNTHIDFHEDYIGMVTVTHTLAMDRWRRRPIIKTAYRSIYSGKVKVLDHSLREFFEVAGDDEITGLIEAIGEVMANRAEALPTTFVSTKVERHAN